MPKVNRFLNDWNKNANLMIKKEKNDFFLLIKLQTQINYYTIIFKRLQV